MKNGQTNPFPLQVSGLAVGCLLLYVTCSLNRSFLPIVYAILCMILQLVLYQPKHTPAWPPFTDVFHREKLLPAKTSKTQVVLTVFAVLNATWLDGSNVSCVWLLQTKMARDVLARSLLECHLVLELELNKISEACTIKRSKVSRGSMGTDL